jgi:hypothetical protein
MATFNSGQQAQLGEQNYATYPGGALGRGIRYRKYLSTQVVAFRAPTALASGDVIEFSGVTGTGVTANILDFAQGLRVLTAGGAAVNANIGLGAYRYIDTDGKPQLVAAQPTFFATGVALPVNGQVAVNFLASLGTNVGNGGFPVPSDEQGEMPLTMTVLGAIPANALILVELTFVSHNQGN